MGLHFVDMIIVAAIGLALFGSKALQSAAREAGKTVGHARQAKDKVMAEVPLDEIVKIKENIPQIPLNSRQAVQMLMTSDEKSNKLTSAYERDEF